MKKKSNRIIKSREDWLEIDISTPKFPSAVMLVDSDVWRKHIGGRVYAWINSTGTYIYASYCVRGTPRLFHQDVMDAHGEHEIDHITHGSLILVDNRRSNLRLVTHSQNAMNGATQANNSSGMRGVSLEKNSGRWLAYIKVHRKHINLGRYDNVDIAIGARLQAEVKYHGSYAFSSHN